MRNQEAVNIKLVQRINRSRVLGEIRNAPEVARAALSGKTGLSAASVSNIAGYLLQTELIRETGRENVDRTGRKGILLRFDGARYRIVTASLADGALHLFLTDLQGTVYAHLEHRLLGASAEATARLLCGGIEQMLASPQAENVLAVGVSVSALVLQDGRRVTSSRLGWNRMDLRARLRSLGDIPVFVSNSSFAKAGWLCRLHPEWSRGLTLFVDMTHGVGAALLRDGERIDTFVGEIGHSVIAPGGEICSCGRRGCLEAMCSPARLLRLYAQGGGHAESLAEFFQMLQSGDGAATRALEDCAAYLGMALGNLINLFNPERIVLNAEDYADCPALPERAIEAMKEHVLDGLNRDAPVFVTRFDPADLARSMAGDLCDALFSPRFETDIFERIDGMSADSEPQRNI